VWWNTQRPVNGCVAYYLTPMSITVFSERKSFELYLFSDDIRKFGLVKAMNEREKELAKLDKDE
jgi:hypothetical protein